MLWTSLISVINLIFKALGGIGGLLFAILPTSPFNNFTLDIPFLSSLNWVLPFNFIINVLAVWLPAVALYYSVSIALRWLKAIE